MMWYEVLTILLVILFFALLISRFIYRKAKGLPTGECECCHKGSKKMLDEYHKMYGKQ